VEEEERSRDGGDGASTRVSEWQYTVVNGQDVPWSMASVARPFQTFGWTVVDCPGGDWTLDTGHCGQALFPRASEESSA
jgi:hypothetical protein